MVLQWGHGIFSVEILLAGNTAITNIKLQLGHGIFAVETPYPDDEYQIPYW